MIMLAIFLSLSLFSHRLFDSARSALRRIHNGLEFILRYVILLLFSSSIEFKWQLIDIHK